MRGLPRQLEDAARRLSSTCAASACPRPSPSTPPRWPSPPRWWRRGSPRSALDGLAWSAITFSARRRISAATSEKPRPTSPALVPSSSALSASRSDLSAISLMNSTTLPICCTRLLSRTTASAMAWLSSFIRCMAARKAAALRCPPWAAAKVRSAMPATDSALSAICWARAGQLLGGGAGLVERAGLLARARLLLRGGGHQLLGGAGDLHAPRAASAPAPAPAAPASARRRPRPAHTSSSAGMTRGGRRSPWAMRVASSVMARRGSDSAEPAAYAVPSTSRMTKPDNSAQRHAPLACGPGSPRPPAPRGPGPRGFVHQLAPRATGTRPG